MSSARASTPLGTPSRKRKDPPSTPMTPSQVALLGVAKKNEAGRKASEKLIARTAAEARDERKEEHKERKEASQQRKEMQAAMFQSLELMEQGRQTDTATLA